MPTNTYLSEMYAYLYKHKIYVLLYVAASEKPKEDVWKVNESLSQEYSTAQEEYKRMRAVVDQLGREYDDSKEVDYFRRYGMLKGMIKRSVLHLKLKDDQNHKPMASTQARDKEEKRKRDERLTGDVSITSFTY